MSVKYGKFEMPQRITVDEETATDQLCSFCRRTV